MARPPMLSTKLLDKMMDVYTEGAGGAFTTVARAAEPCRLGQIDTGGARSAPERAELASLRRLVWGPGYALPAHCQVEIDGERWNPVEGTHAAPTWPFDGTVIYRSCDVQKDE